MLHYRRNTAATVPRFPQRCADAARGHAPTGLRPAAATLGRRRGSWGRSQRPVRRAEDAFRLRHSASRARGALQALLNRILGRRQWSAITRSFALADSASRLSHDRKASARHAVVQGCDLLAQRVARSRSIWVICSSTRAKRRSSESVIRRAAVRRWASTKCLAMPVTMPQRGACGRIRRSFAGDKHCVLQQVVDRSLILDRGAEEGRQRIDILAHENLEERQGFNGGRSRTFDHETTTPQSLLVADSSPRTENSRRRGFSVRHGRVGDKKGRKTFRTRNAALTHRAGEGLIMARYRSSKQPRPHKLSAIRLQIAAILLAGVLSVCVDTADAADMKPAAAPRWPTSGRAVRARRPSRLRRSQTRQRRIARAGPSSRRLRDRRLHGDQQTILRVPQCGFGEKAIEVRAAVCT